MRIAEREDEKMKRWEKRRDEKLGRKKIVKREEEVEEGRKEGSKWK